MEPKAIFNYCKSLGCCDACCLRYIGIKSSNAYEKASNYVTKYQVDSNASSSSNKNDESSTEVKDVDHSNNPTENVNIIINDKNNDSLSNNDKEESDKRNGSSSPPHKRRKLDICGSCLGILQEDGWQEAYDMVKEVLVKKGYECKTFACGLSAPICTILRERAITLRLTDQYPEYDFRNVTPLKEAWKYSFGIKLATHIDKTLDSGAVSPLLITVNMDYDDDLQELEILKTMSPQFFEERRNHKRRFNNEFTRRSVEQALEKATLSSLMSAGGGLPAASAHAHCVSVTCVHAPMYLGGRYVKLSRKLPQSPWILEGKRVVPSSVQEIIYRPIADIYNQRKARESPNKAGPPKTFPEDTASHSSSSFPSPPPSSPTHSTTQTTQHNSLHRDAFKKPAPLGDSRTFNKIIDDNMFDPEEADARLKFIAAGREDVDVRCLGDGRPFAIEITDPVRELTTEELLQVCEEINKSEDVIVKKIVPISKEDLTQLKKGEETKSKTYEALCIKLSHSEYDEVSDNSPIQVTPKDIEIINKYTQKYNQIKQKTPIRVLHRRPLLTRTKEILELKGETVADNPQLFRIFVHTSAGTYVKEWVHGEFGRTVPSLGSVLQAKVDLLALDVTAVHLDWPPEK